MNLIWNSKQREFGSEFYFGVIYWFLYSLVHSLTSIHRKSYLIFSTPNAKSEIAFMLTRSLIACEFDFHYPLENEWEEKV